MSAEEQGRSFADWVHPRHPILLREWGFHRPQRTILRNGAALCMAIIAAPVLARYFQLLPALLRLTDLAWMLGFALLGFFAFWQFLFLRAHLASSIPRDLTLTLVSFRETASALHLALLPTYFLFCSVFILLLPWNSEAFVLIPFERVVLFLAAFLVVSEAVMRLVFFLPLHLAGTALFSSTFMAIFCGVLVIYGVGGALDRMPADWVFSVLAWVMFLVLPGFLSRATWGAFVEAAGKSYGWRVRVLLGEEDLILNEPEPRRFF